MRKNRIRFLCSMLLSSTFFVGQTSNLNSYVSAMNMVGDHGSNEEEENEGGFDTDLALKIGAGGIVIGGTLFIVTKKSNNKQMGSTDAKGFSEKVSSNEIHTVNSKPKPWSHLKNAGNTCYIDTVADVIRQSMPDLRNKINQMINAGNLNHENSVRVKAMKTLISAPEAGTASAEDLRQAYEDLGHRGQFGKAEDVFERLLDDLGLDVGSLSVPGGVEDVNDFVTTSCNVDDLDFAKLNPKQKRVAQNERRQNCKLISRCDYLMITTYPSYDNSVRIELNEELGYKLLPEQHGVPMNNFETLNVSTVNNIRFTLKGVFVNLGNTHWVGISRGEDGRYSLFNDQKENVIEMSKEEVVNYLYNNATCAALIYKKN